MIGSEDSIKNARWAAVTSTISAIAAVMAVAIVAVPAAWQYYHRPQAHMTAVIYKGQKSSVSDYDKVHSQIDLAGDSEHVPDNSDVWVVVRGIAEGRWYPTTRVSDDEWTTENTALRMATGRQDVYLYLVPISRDQALIDYVKTLNISRTKNREIDPGLSAIPEGDVLQVLHLNVVD